MKLAVVDYIPELFGSGSVQSVKNYCGGAVIETAFFLMEDESAYALHDKIMDIRRVSTLITQATLYMPRALTATS